MQCACIEPALRRNHAVPRIDTNSDSVAIRMDGIPDEYRIFNGSRTENHTRNSLFQISFHRRHIPDTAPKLHPKAAVPGDFQENMFILCTALFSAVEVNHMNPRSTCGTERRGCLYRILRYFVRCRKIPAAKAHAAPILDIDRR